MFAAAPERRMRTVRASLLILWAVLIASLFWDPVTPSLTHPDHLWSPFRIHPEDEVLVQGRPLPATPYPMGARIFWTMTIPLVPMFLMLFGHEAWRRVCPLSLSSQLAQYLGLQAKKRTFNRRSGHVEHHTRLLGATSTMARNVWFVQFGLLWLGITGRLLFMNSNRTFLACFLLGLIALAVTVGFLFGGKTWCNYICPIAPVQKIYTGPGGLLESKAYLAQGVRQSTCRRPGPDGDQSTCVGCTASCPDIDLERSYWDGLFKPGKRFAYYGYFGLVVAFYSYYYLYSGNWDYYFSGAWTHEEGQLATLMSPGFYLAGVAVPLPKVVAAPLTTAGFVLAAYLLGLLLERAYGGLRSLVRRPISLERLRHQGLTFSAFATFNVFYLFAGRPNLNLLPPPALKVVDTLIVLVSTIWLVRSIRAASATYRRESLARSMLRQLGQLKMDFSAILEGRNLGDLNADEIYILSRTLSRLPDEKRESLYRNVLLDALVRGEVSPESSLEAMAEIRRQLNIGEDEHAAALAHVVKLAPASSAGARSDPSRLRLANYSLALEPIATRCLETRRPLREELRSPSNEREVQKLRGLFDISDSEHEAAVSELLRSGNIVLREARVLLERIAEVHHRIKALKGPGAWSRAEGVDMLLRHLESSRYDLQFRLRHLLTAAGEGTERLARWCNVALDGEAREVLEVDPAGSGPEAETAELPPGVAEVLAEDLLTSEERLDPDLKSALPDLRAQLSERPGPLDVLADMAREPDPSAATIALHVLAQIDPQRGRSVSEERLRAGDRHWLVDEVARAIAADKASPERGGGAEVRPEGSADFVVETAGTPSKMVHLFRSDFFRHLGLDALASIARSAEVCTYRRGGTVCRVGEPSDRVFVVCSGGAEVRVERDGRSVWANAIGEGDSIGELGVLTGRPRAATVVISRDGTKLISIAGADLISVLNRNARASMSFLKLLSTRQQGMLARISER